MESMYSTTTQLNVEPDHYSDGVPVFKPSMAEFENFYTFNKAINKYGMQSGIVKIIPPKEWKASLPKYTPKSLEKIKIKNPIIQHISGSGAGIYSSQNIERQRTYTIAQWKELSNQSNYQPPAPRGKLRSDAKTQKDQNQTTPPVQAPPPASPSKVIPPSERQLRKRSVSVTESKTTPSASSSPTKAASSTSPHHHPHTQHTYSHNFKNYNIDTSEFTEERCEKLESVYWKTLTYAEPMYGADSLGSLFPPNFKTWNVAHLPNILDLLDAKLPGVNDAYLYAGLWKATFSWHLEDQDLYSINYLHFGAPKQWYSIPQEQATKFYNLMKDAFPEDSRVCSEFLRHKTYMMSPQYLSKHGIEVNKIVHREGEFIITYPYGYHSGFNYGYNLAESVNFALEEWFPFGESSKKCECIADAVGINVKMLYCKFKGIDYELEEKKRIEKELQEIREREEKLEQEERLKNEAKKAKRRERNKSVSKDEKVPPKEDLATKESKISKSPLRKEAKKSTPPSILYLKNKINEDATAKEATSESEPVRIERRGRPRKTPLVELTPKTIKYQCYLCPNNLPKSLLKLRPFELLNTEIIDRESSLPLQAHRLCSEQFKEIKLTGGENGQLVTGLSDISDAQKGLQCIVCSPKKGKKATKDKKEQESHGICFQCDNPKCVRSFHATCAVGDGFSFDKQSRKCKFHRGKVVFHKCNSLKTERISKIMRNSIVQFNTVTKEIFSGLVVANNPDEGHLRVSIYPHIKEVMEIPYDSILFSDDAKVDVEQNSELLYKRSSKKKAEKEKGAADFKFIENKIEPVKEPPKNISKEVITSDFSVYPPPIHVRKESASKQAVGIDDDLSVTGVTDSSLKKTIRGKFVIEKLTRHTTVSPKNAVSSDKWWYYLNKRSSDVIARYANDIRLKEPNDANYLKLLEREKKKRSLAGSGEPQPKKAVKFTQVVFKQHEKGKAASKKPRAISSQKKYTQRSQSLPQLMHTPQLGNFSATAPTVGYPIFQARPEYYQGNAIMQTNTGASNSNLISNASGNVNVNVSNIGNLIPERLDQNASYINNQRIYNGDSHSQHPHPGHGYSIVPIVPH